MKVASIRAFRRKPLRYKTQIRELRTTGEKLLQFYVVGKSIIVQFVFILLSNLARDIVLKEKIGLFEKISFFVDILLQRLMIEKLKCERWIIIEPGLSDLPFYCVDQEI